MQICENIKQARISSGLTQGEMATRLHLKNLTTYQNWEYKTEPSLEMINKIGKAIGIAPVSLLSGVIDFTAQDIADTAEQINRKKETDVMISLAKLTSAIGTLVGLDKGQIFQTVESVASGRTGVVSQDLTHRAGKKGNRGN